MDRHRVRLVSEGRLLVIRIPAIDYCAEQLGRFFRVIDRRVRFVLVPFDFCRLDGPS